MHLKESILTNKSYKNKMINELKSDLKNTREDLLSVKKLNLQLGKKNNDL